MIQNYGQRLEDKDLDLAYKRAGTKFGGLMRQIFGILKDKEDLDKDLDKDQNNGSQNQNQTRKRRAQDNEQQTKRTK